MTSSNFSLEPSARPPDTMILAPESSGRSEWTTASETNFETAGSEAAPTLSTEAEPPSAAAAKAAVRMVSTLILSVERTVSTALPA